ncbi:MAG TPA: glycosyltransferase family 39 protein [Chitinophagaceae bacterium]|nr:glycosyltransferase family 39 protein [Chitinophagaceae bacterium]
MQKNHRFLFYSCWIILGIIQSGFTELQDDEAYYWVYSKFLDWGYFDHPPMVALLIKIGYFFFHNELGVRLVFLLLNTLSLVLIEKLIDNKKPFLFYAIALSLAVLQLGGFWAVPDTPLIFFTALFFLCYRKFLRQASLLNTFLLGLAAAALLYSKYHAVLIIFFVLLSNLKLLTRYQVYISGIIAFLLFTPHLWWQYQHDWISFRYHLFESNVNPYKFSFTMEYLGGQILLAGPLAGLILLPSAFLYHHKNIIEKGLKFTLAGIYIFFLVSSLRGRVEANWTSPALVPLIILSHNFLAEKKNWLKWLLRLLPATMVFVLFARIIMIVDILPFKEIKKRFHGWKEWPALMKEKTNGLPVVFENSYQRASKYWFYSGQVTYSLNLYKERRNNYNFWPIEDSLLGKPVFIFDVHNLDSFKTKIQTGIGTLAYKYDSSYSSFAKVAFIPSKTLITSKENNPFTIEISPELPPEYSRYIAGHPELKIKIVLAVFDKYGWIKDLPVSQTLQELVHQQTTLYFNPGLPVGKYNLIFSIFHIGNITATHNSPKIKLKIE